MHCLMRGANIQMQERGYLTNLNESNAEACLLSVCFRRPFSFPPVAGNSHGCATHYKPPLWALCLLKRLNACHIHANQNQEWSIMKLKIRVLPNGMLQCRNQKCHFGLSTGPFLVHLDQQLGLFGFWVSNISSWKESTGKRQPSATSLAWCVGARLPSVMKLGKNIF